MMYKNLQQDMTQQLFHAVHPVACIPPFRRPFGAMFFTVAFGSLYSHTFLFTAVESDRFKIAIVPSLRELLLLLSRCL